MEKVTKVFYDPLLRDKEQIEAVLSTLPIGSAHPFRGELLVHSTENVVTTIDISMHADDYFTNAVSLGDLGEQVLDRMKLFPHEIGVFNEEYHIQQAPASSFRVPIVDGLIHIFAVSVREPAYYDLCVGDSNFRTCCYKAERTFSGMTHSGDCNSGNVLLQHLRLTSALDETSRTVFVSGYHNHALHKYKKRNPLVLVANHSIKTLYVVPVPLDTATIGHEATLCCPLVIKKEGSTNTLLCSILPTPTIDKNMYCSDSTLKTAAFASAISRASALLEEPEVSVEPRLAINNTFDRGPVKPTKHDTSIRGRHVLIATHFCTINQLEAPISSRGTELTGQSTISNTATPQIIRFGKGIEWMQENQHSRAGENASSVLPCVLGGMMEGPMLLAIGEPPSGVPFSNVAELHEYYRQARSIVVLVDENMTDNARNVALSWRLNGLFILQTNKADTPDHGADVIPVLNRLNVNAVTALAGPQSLVLVQLGTRYFFYRGIANPQMLSASNWRFGQDVTELISSYGLTRFSEQVHAPSWSRLVNLSEDNLVHLPKTNRVMGLEDIKTTFREAPMDDLLALKDDIAMIVPQLQVLLAQDKLHEICQTLVQLVAAKVRDDMEFLRREYSTFVVHEFDASDVESHKRKNALLSNLRKTTKAAQSNVQWLTEALGNVVSSQTTSSRAHDLKRLARQTAIEGNVAAAKAMTFEKLSAILEDHAAEMGVLVVNVRTNPYTHYISNSLYLEESRPSTTGDECFLDPRILYLQGLDAGIVLEASQPEHSGPLVSQQGRDHPILALPYLNKSLESDGSMLAWVCWDEFVQLSNPYKVRWMEKCNDPNIAALRIIMRSTLSQAVSSRTVTNLTPSSKETGQLMGALLMTAMRKLAETRSTVPEVASKSLPYEGSSLGKADLVTLENSVDTSTLLMRGLFGNLLTIAGAGTQPLSFVWQLFGKVPTFDIPTSRVTWSWYEHTTRMLPYSAWPLKQYKINVVGLLDKLIFRMMTKNEKPNKDLAGNTKRVTALQNYCVARNIQLLHSRTIITILEHMLTEQSNLDCQASAQRLLQVVPQQVENETQSYTRLYCYIHHLAEGGKQRSHDNLIAANVFTKRSAVFSEGKQRLVRLLSEKDVNRQKVVEAYQQLSATKTTIEKAWGLEDGVVKMQNSKLWQDVFDAALGQTGLFHLSKEVICKARGDAELTRKPWQIGDKGEYGEIEKLDQKLVVQVLGEGSNAIKQHGQEEASRQNKDTEQEAAVVIVDQDEFGKFRETVKADFLQDAKSASSMEDVCRLLGITAGAMEAFVEMLVPDQKVEIVDRISFTFQQTVLTLLRDRCRDAERIKPTRMLFGGISPLLE